jgi:hypothetical protein
MAIFHRNIPTQVMTILLMLLALYPLTILLLMVPLLDRLYHMTIPISTQRMHHHIPTSTNSRIQIHTSPRAPMTRGTLKM